MGFFSNVTKLITDIADIAKQDDLSLSQRLDGVIEAVEEADRRFDAEPENSGGGNDVIRK